MPEIEMTYFPIHGFRGLMPRLVMHLGEIPFTEKIIQMQDWATVKPTTLLGYLPEVKIDGVIYAQTTPILNYLQKIGKMDKLTDEEQMRSGMMLETVTEVFLGMVMPAFKLVRGEMTDQPREKQCEAFQAKVRETTKEQFPKIEKVLKHFNKTEAICPAKICVGDLSILAMYMCSQYFKNEDDFNTLIPSAVPMIKKLMANQKIAQWVKSQESVPFCPY